MGLRNIVKQVKKEQDALNKTFEEQFLETVDDYLVKSRSSKDNSRPRSLTIKPSSYYRCARQLWYDLLRFPRIEKKYPRPIRIMEVGTALHEWIQTQIFMTMDQEGFKNIKLIPANEIPAYGKEGIEFIKEHNAPDMEVKFIDRRHTKRYPISAMIDGAFSYLDKDTLFEFKTIKSEEFNLLFEPLKDHIKQGAIYSLCLGVPNVLFLYLNKNDQYFKAYLITYTEQQINWVRDRVALLDENLINLVLPNKEPEHGCDFCAFKFFCEKDYAGSEFKEIDGHKEFIK